LENWKEKIVNEAKRIEEDSLYSSHSHFIAANRWSKYHLWLGGLSVILATTAGAQILSEYGGNRFIPGALSLFAASLTVIMTVLNPYGKASTHQTAGTNYRELRNKTRIFYEIECFGTKSPDYLEKTLKDLSLKRDQLNKTSPQIPRWAYEAARKGIEEGEVSYIIDEKK
jgi:hypothetical protein